MRDFSNLLKTEIICLVWLPTKQSAEDLFLPNRFLQELL